MKTKTTISIHSDLKRWKRSRFLFLLFILCATCNCHTPLQADIKTNLAKGEHLSYDLYFSWNLVWMRGGKIDISSEIADYENGKAIKCTMIAATSKFADKIYKVRDTVVSYLDTHTLKTLSFRKSANEGKKYSAVEGATFTYRDNEVDVYAFKKKPGRDIDEADLTITRECTDMAGVIHLIRSLDPKTIKTTDVPLVIFEGKKKYNMKLHYIKDEEIKANDDQKYQCNKYTLFIDNDEAFLDEESMSFWLTDDEERLPIRIDTKIKIGTLRGVFEGKR